MASKLRIHDPETLEAFSFLATLPSPDGCECGRIPQHVLRELYRKQAILFSVPVNPSDVVVVPTLRGFVMNRSIQECDVFERVLYDFLLTTDSHTTVQDVAEILQQNTDLVCFVASIALRLGFACKLNAVRGCLVFFFSFSFFLVHFLYASQRYFLCFPFPEIYLNPIFFCNFE